MEYRVEKDLLGEMKLPSSRYYGIHTQRALENFNLAGEKVNRSLIEAMAIVKKAACFANRELEYLPEDKSDAIAAACDEIIRGDLKDEFPLDALQGGAGTSTNMNLNEVIANRALELLGKKKGEYEFIHPVEHVNLHQSTNDVYPTALKVAVIFKLRELSGKLAELQSEFQRKEQDFAHIIKLGRTEMQEAVPITLGAEFSAFAEAFARDRWRTFKAEERIRQVNIGGTAVGTGLTAPKKYIFLVIEKLRELTGLGLARGENCVDQTSNADSFVEVTGIMQACSVDFEKVCRDLRLMHFLREISLPAMQAGSSIMPGKVNPVIMESVIQGAVKVRALNHVVEGCAAGGTLQINEYLPLLADSLLKSLDMLSAMADMLTAHCAKIGPNEKNCLEALNNSVSIITAFLPEIGYLKAEELLREFASVREKTLFRDFLERKLGKEEVKKTLSPHNLVSLGYRD